MLRQVSTAAQETGKFACDVASRFCAERVVCISIFCLCEGADTMPVQEMKKSEANTVGFLVAA